MHTVTIENLPTDLYERLQQSAIEHGRTLEHEVVVWLKQALVINRVDPDLFIARLDALEQQVSLPPLTDEFLRQAKEEGRL